MSKPHELYKTLDDQLAAGEWASAVATADKLLAQKDEKEAQKAKAFALLHLGKFNEVTHLTTKNSALAKELTFERAYALYQLGKNGEALEVIRSATASPGLLQLQAQIYFRIEDARAVEAYEKLSASNQSAAVMTNLAAAYTQNNQASKATQIYESINNGNVKETQDPQVLKKLATFKLESGNWREAAQSLEKVLQSNPNDSEAKSLFVEAVAHYDPIAADKYASKFFPELPGTSHVKIDVDKLESGDTVSFRRKEKVAEGKPGEVANKKKTNKKKKKKRLPKDMTKPIDPERWLPMRERSYFKSRRGKRGGGRTVGAQGAATVSVAHVTAGKGGGTVLAKPQEELEQLRAAQAAAAAAALAKAPAKAPAAAPKQIPKHPPKGGKKKGRR